MFSAQGLLQNSSFCEEILQREGRSFRWRDHLDYIKRVRVDYQKSIILDPYGGGRGGGQEWWQSTMISVPVFLSYM